jgi:acyl carrier protein
MVNEYLKRIQEPNHSSLCFRDLIKRAQQELLDLNAQTPTPESTPAVMPETTKASAESSIVTTHVSPTQESSKIQEKPNTQTFKAQTTPEISAETPFREHLKTQLKNYIHRIEVTQNSDFKYGFWFFKQSRATNRHANYKLAQNFLEHLNQEKSLLELFADIEQQRTDLIKINKLNQKDNHGIHSADLLNIIAAAKKFIHEEHPEEANCFCVRSK